jgi:hypothetical protein
LTLMKYHRQFTKLSKHHLFELLFDKTDARGA